MIMMLCARHLKRRPRNEVARFILSDLDNAYNYMLPTAPVTNRLNRDCAALVKSRVALFEGTWEKYHKGTEFCSWWSRLARSKYGLSKRF